jgi:hypothetical protein
MKKRFKVLTDQLEYSYTFQVRIVKAICTLHNIIRLTGGDDIFDELWIQTNAHTGSSKASLEEAGIEVVAHKAVSNADLKYENALRDSIAEQMWTQYSRFRRQNRID